jgi:hypothetical protein
LVYKEKNMSYAFIDSSQRLLRPQFYHDLWTAFRRGGGDHLVFEGPPLRRRDAARALRLFAATTLERLLDEGHPSLRVARLYALGGVLPEDLRSYRATTGRGDYTPLELALYDLLDESACQAAWTASLTGLVLHDDQRQTEEDYQNHDLTLAIVSHLGPPI